MEPTPQQSHVEKFRRGDQWVDLHVKSDGTVRCSAEFMREVLTQAGWQSDPRCPTCDNYRLVDGLEPCPSCAGGAR